MITAEVAFKANEAFVFKMRDQRKLKARSYKVEEWKACCIVMNYLFERNVEMVEKWESNSLSRM